MATAAQLAARAKFTAMVKAKAAKKKKSTGTKKKKVKAFVMSCVFRFHEKPNGRTL